MTWNPHDQICFHWKGPSLGGLRPYLNENKQTGSRKKATFKSGRKQNYSISPSDVLVDGWLFFFKMRFPWFRGTR